MGIDELLLVERSNREDPLVGGRIGRLVALLSPVAGGGDEDQALFLALFDGGAHHLVVGAGDAHVDGVDLALDHPLDGLDEADGTADDLARFLLLEHVSGFQRGAGQEPPPLRLADHDGGHRRAVVLGAGSAAVLVEGLELDLLPLEGRMVDIDRPVDHAEPDARPACDFRLAPSDQGTGKTGRELGQGLCLKVMVGVHRNARVLRGEHAPCLLNGCPA